MIEGYSEYQDESGLRQELGPGDLLLLYPNLSLAYYHLPEKGAWSEFYIVFEGAIFDLWQEKGILNPRRPIHHLEPMEYWLRRLEAVIESDPNLQQDDSLTRVCRLQLALGDALAYERQHGEARADWEWLVQAMLAIEQNSQGLRTDWKKVAWNMKMSYERFRKKFVQVAGYTPSTYRIRYVLDQASGVLLVMISAPPLRRGTQTGSP